MCVRQDLDRERREKSGGGGEVGCPAASEVEQRVLFGVGQIGSDLAAFAITSLVACGLAGPFESVARI